MAISTYRVQLHAGFDFNSAASLVPYLARLGITHLYCSPFLQAADGSQHGYDVVDPTRLNAELGGKAGFANLSAILAEYGLKLMLDIVPNHMAAIAKNNPWWWDVLENGPSSRYANHFDIRWQGLTAREDRSVLVPVLGDHFGRVIDAGEIKLDHSAGHFLVRYYDHTLPLAPRSLDELLAAAAQRSRSDALSALAAAFRNLPLVLDRDPEGLRTRHQLKSWLLEQVETLCRDAPEIMLAIRSELAAISEDPERLDALLRRQHYRLALWRIAGEELDYRRFFNIETLVGLRIEEPEVFADSHRLIQELVRNGQVDALRVDHIDGLLDPLAYLHRLQTSCGPIFVVVEKILEAREGLPGHWPVAGTTGYDFLNHVNNLFVDSDQEEALTRCYADFTGEADCWSSVVYLAKQQIMNEELRAEVDLLTQLLFRICDDLRRHRDHTRRELREALIELLTAFPVYRTYHGDSAAERTHVEAAVAQASRGRKGLDGELLELMGSLLIRPSSDPLKNEFAARFAQISGPVMAKGVEDTAFYRYNRLISLNEVGGDPGTFGRPTAAFHRSMQHLASAWPQTMTTLSTHDTKRSADVRARIALLSEVPAAFATALADFARINGHYRRAEGPDRNTEYMLYQTLIGAFPLEVERACRFAEKATREAKVHTSWVAPNPAYDAAVQCFVRDILADPDFTAALYTFVTSHRLIERGRINSLAQTALLLTCPGSPDIYQGTDGWDYSLVDPDNRRPVDYTARAATFDAWARRAPLPHLEQDELGQSKLWLITRLLQHRRAHPACYDNRRYRPLQSAGTKAAHVVAFERKELIVLVPRLVMGLGDGWEDTTVELPGGTWVDLLTCEHKAGGTRPLSELCDPWPICILSRHAAPPPDY